MSPPTGAKSSNNLRDKLDDDILDLSLMQLTEVPVKEIGALPKGTTLDLSNNMLTFLPESFPMLTHLVKLDLSKNQLCELPEFFGHLKNLRHLDLYSNQLERLPVSFAQLRSLKWLDLKNNPLVPAVLQAAGPCITASDCAMCAKKVVALLQSMQSQLERERQKHAMEEQAMLAQRRAKEDHERDRLRAEKRAAKERRREEQAARAKEGGNSSDGGSGGRSRNEQGDGLLHEMERPRASNGRAAGSGGSGRKGGWCWSLLMFMMGVLLVLVASAISLLWIYTGGHLDQKSIDSALPVIRRDVDATFLTLGKKAEGFYEDSSRAVGPYVKGAAERARALWTEAAKRQKAVAHWVNVNLGPTCCSMAGRAKAGWFWAQGQVGEGWRWLRPRAEEAWAAARPHFQRLGEAIIEWSLAAWGWAGTNVPVYCEWVWAKAGEAGGVVNGWING